MSETIRTVVDPASMAELLQRAGYRASVAEQQGAPRVQSAAQGLAFFLAFGNPAPVATGGYADFAFHCWITIRDELPPGLVEDWNREMRFARLFRQDKLLVLTLDVLVAGGVTDEFLLAQVELWDRVVHDFIRHLRRPAAGAVA